MDEKKSTRGQAVHVCLHEEDWGKFKQVVEDLKSDIDGNGKKGLRDTVTELTASTQQLKDSIDQFRSQIGQLLEFKTVVETTQKNWQKNIITWLTVIGLAFTGINVFFGVLNRTRIHDKPTIEYTQPGKSEQQATRRIDPPIVFRNGRIIDSASNEYFE